MTIQQLLQIAVERNASDLHLIVDYPPILRINGEVVRLTNSQNLTKQDLEALVFPLLTELQKNIFKNELELDFGIDLEKRNRFRVNLYYQKSSPAASFRVIPSL